MCDFYSKIFIPNHKKQVLAVFWLIFAKMAEFCVRITELPQRKSNTYLDAGYMTFITIFYFQIIKIKFWLFLGNFAKMAEFLGWKWDVPKVNG